MGNCAAGCKVLGNLNSGEDEIYHHKDCVNYPESMSFLLDVYKNREEKLLGLGMRMHVLELSLSDGIRNYKNIEKKLRKECEEKQCLEEKTQDLESRLLDADKNYKHLERKLHSLKRLYLDTIYSYSIGTRSER